MNVRPGYLILVALCIATVRTPFVFGIEPNAKWDPMLIDARIEAWQPTKAERAFDEIAWAKDLTEAERLAKEHGRPIFMFTYDGTNLACFRC